MRTPQPSLDNSLSHGLGSSLHGRVWRHIPAAVFSVRGKLLSLSGPAAHLFEQPASETAPVHIHARFLDKKGGALSSRDLPWVKAGRRRKPVRDTVMGLVMPDGSRRWVKCSCLPEPLPGSKDPVILAMFTDVTDRVIYEKQLRAQLRYESALTACASQVLCASGFCGSCRAMRLLMDIPRSEIPGVSRALIFENHMDPTEGPQACLTVRGEDPLPSEAVSLSWSGAFARWESVLKTNGMLNVSAARAPEPVARFLQSWKLQAATIMPLFAGGTWLGFMLYGSAAGNLRWSQRDLHHLKTTARIAGSMLGRKRLQEQMLQAQKMEAIGSLASGLAHDFNNILSGIRSTLQLLLLDRHQDGKLVEDLHAIHEEVVRASDLAKRILTFSRPSRGHSSIVELNEQIHLLSRHIRRILPKHISTKLQLIEGRLPVRIDAVQF
ncbi:MAG: histidine kinase dimerization/phospho-acceptor domain-containing protein, partial [Lentisphaerota bacterium]